MLVGLLIGLTTTTGAIISQGHIGHISYEVVTSHGLIQDSAIGVTSHTRNLSSRAGDIL